MSSSPPKRIIRDAKVEGVFFCRSEETNSQEKNESLSKEEESIHQKNLSKGTLKDFEAALQGAETAGYQRGLKQGHLQGYETGKSEGLDIGFKLGVSNAHVEMKAGLELLNKITATFFTKQEEMFEMSKPEIIKFALAVCDNLLHNALSQHQVFTAHIEKLLIRAKEILKDASVDVILAPEDLAMLQGHLHSVGNDREEFEKLNFISDSTMERGNCRLETSLGLLNFDIKRLLSDIEKKTLEAGL
jgi:flagellar assembly protein FliH